jgi:hypothetical protein
MQTVQMNGTQKIHLLLARIYEVHVVNGVRRSFSGKSPFEN